MQILLWISVGIEMRVALIVNTRKSGSEFEVEYDPPHTIELIKQGIESSGNEYVFIEADDKVVEHIKEVWPDLVFNRSEGIRGESRESHVPAVLEMLGVPYVGANVLTTAVCLNKGWTKKILAYHGIPTPDFHICTTLEEALDISLKYPFILKPNEEGSSIGINEDNVVHNKEQLAEKLKQMLDEYEQGILLEQFIQGREFSVGVLGKTDGGFEVFPVLEVDFSTLPHEVGGVFGQRAKTIYEELDHYICPAKISEVIRAELERITIDICKHLMVPDFARVDYRMDEDGNLYFLEINPLPGMDFDLENKDISFYPYMAIQGGYTYNTLIHRLLDSARSRYGL